jgi:hypothetical protein
MFPFENATTKGRAAVVIAIITVTIVLIAALTLIVVLDKTDSLEALLGVIVPAITTIVLLVTQHTNAANTQKTVSQSGKAVATAVNGNIEAAVGNILSTTLPGLLADLLDKHNNAPPCEPAAATVQPNSAALAPLGGEERKAVG